MFGDRVDVEKSQRVPLIDFFGIVKLFFENFPPKGSPSIFLMICNNDVRKSQRVLVCFFFGLVTFFQKIFPQKVPLQLFDDLQQLIFKNPKGPSFVFFAFVKLFFENFSPKGPASIFLMICNNGC